jgi:sugar phosphate isomerase/epimerase
MFKNLNLGAIGIKATLGESIDYARRYGFIGIDFSITEAVTLAETIGMDGVRDLFENAGVFPGSWGFPVNYRQDDAAWREGLMMLPKQAEFALELGCTRTATWILPASDERNFHENFEFHVNRLRPAAQILADYGCRFGLEFIGPKTLRTPRKYNFVHTMDGMLALCAAIGTGNVGLLLDVWHLYTAHVNDAPAGIPVDEQIDNVRALPGETGVLDLQGFLDALRAIGYDGPITAEPFSKRVNSMKPDDALQATADAMTKIGL